MDNKIAIAKIKNIKGSARKTRIVINAIKKMTPLDAIEHLSFMNYRNSPVLLKIIKTAINNANVLKMEAPYVFEEIKVDEGMTRQGIRFKSKGMVEIRRKRYCNITVKIKEDIKE